jgi:hypothetical protein
MTSIVPYGAEFFIKLRRLMAGECIEKKGPSSSATTGFIGLVLGSLLNV